MNPEFSDFYQYDEDDPSVKIRVDYFEERAPTAWLEVDGKFALPLNPSQLCVLRLLSKDASQDVDEWMMETYGEVSA